MWLLNTETLELEDFIRNVPEYAILSHRWEEKQELTYGNVTEASSHLRGHQKVITFCEIARSNGYKYGWVDTCCIDKKSSAEISEAINSMYKWYRNCAVCYAYLNDVYFGDDLPNSSWFTRGGTLQELLAPERLLFFDTLWKPMFWKSNILRRLENWTGIPDTALRKFDPAKHCVATKMSWAAKRETTHKEDSAYCLLGLFDVNMPLLYGEGPKAFQRLQEEIMRVSTDTSLFVWQSEASKNHGMLASSPSCFVATPWSFDDHFAIEPDGNSRGCVPRGWVSNNAGIQIDASMIPFALVEDFVEVYLLLLNHSHILQHGKHIAIYVRKHPTIEQSYSRVAVDGKCWKVLDIDEILAFHSVVHPIGQRFLTRALLSHHPLTGSPGFEVRVNLQYSGQVIARVRPDEDRWEPLLSTWKAVGELSIDSMDWLQFNKHEAECHSSIWPSFDEQIDHIQCSFTAHPRKAWGILGHLVVAGITDVDLLICFGFDNRVRPISTTVPFCARLVKGDLTESKLMKNLNTVHGTDDCRSQPCEQRAVGYVASNPYYKNETWCFGIHGVSVQVNHQHDGTGRYSADVHLDGYEFLTSHGIRGDQEGGRSYPDSAKERVQALESQLIVSRGSLFS